MDKILDFIDEKIDENNIFVYCYNGLTVSPLIVALYMIKKVIFQKMILEIYLNLKTIIFAWILIYLCSNHIWNLPLLSIGLSTRFSIVPNHHSSPPFEKCVLQNHYNLLSFVEHIGLHVLHSKLMLYLFSFF